MSKKIIMNRSFFFFQLESPDLDALQKDGGLWSLSNVPLLEGFLSVMDGDPLQDVVKAVIDQYKSHVQPKINSFQTGNRRSMNFITHRPHI